MQQKQETSTNKHNKVAANETSTTDYSDYNDYNDTVKQILQSFRYDIIFIGFAWVFAYFCL